MQLLTGLSLVDADAAPLPSVPRPYSPPGGVGPYGSVYRQGTNIQHAPRKVSGRIDKDLLWVYPICRACRTAMRSWRTNGAAITSAGRILGTTDIQDCGTKWRFPVCSSLERRQQFAMNAGGILPASKTSTSRSDASLNN